MDYYNDRNDLNKRIAAACRPVQGSLSCFTRLHRARPCHVLLRAVFKVDGSGRAFLARALDPQVRRIALARIEAERRAAVVGAHLDDVGIA